MSPVPDIIRAVVDDIEVQSSVSVHIRERHRHAAELAGRSSRLSHVGKLPMSVVQKADHTAAADGDEQVHVTIAVDIGENGAATTLAIAGHARLPGHVLEFPVSQVLVERVSSIQTAEINVRQAVIVIISGGNSGSVVEHSIGRAGFFVQRIGKCDSRLLRREECKSIFSFLGDIQLGPLKCFLPVPFRFLAAQETRLPELAEEDKPDENGSSHLNSSSVKMACSQHSVFSLPKSFG